MAQEKYVPTKVQRLKNVENIKNFPIKVLKDSKKDYHIIDGHHRFLMTKRSGNKVIKADIY